MKTCAALALFCLVASAAAFAPAPVKRVSSSLNIVPLKRPEGEYIFDDGLSELERKQRGGAMSTFLTGSAKSQADPSAITDKYADTSVEIPGWFSALGSVIGTFIFFAIAKASLDPTAYFN